MPSTTDFAEPAGGAACLYWGDDLIPGRRNDAAVLWIVFFGLHVDLICMNPEVLF